MLRQLVKQTIGLSLFSKIEDIYFRLFYGSIKTASRDDRSLEIRRKNKSLVVTSDNKEIITTLQAKHEEKNIAIFLDFVPLVETFYDIGANIGVYSVLAGTLMEKSKKKVAFEPNPLIYDVLKSNINSYNFLSYNVALSNSNYDCYVTNSERTPEITIDPNVTEGQKITCKISGDFISSNDKTVFIKLDVEGHEYEVLNGLVDKMLEMKKAYIYIEVHFALLKKYNKYALFFNEVDKIKKLGFKSLWIDRSHLLLIKK